MVLADSLFIYKKGRTKVVDHLANRLLFLHEPTATLIETDLQGKVLNEFSRTGQGDDLWGEHVDNVGYFDDSTIVVVTTKGYNFYNCKGRFLRRISSRNVMALPPLWRRIRSVHTAGHRYLVSRFKYQELDQAKAVKEFGTKASLVQYQPLTIYDLESDTFRLAFGYEPESIFLKEDYYYPTRNTFFEYNPLDSSVLIVQSPEAKIYRYNAVDNFTLQSVYSFVPSRFSVPIKAKYGSPIPDIVTALTINSEFTSLHQHQDITLITYQTGVPKEIYNPLEMQNKTYFGAHSKNYLIALRNYQQIGDAVLLSKTNLSIIYSFVNLNYLVGRSYSNPHEYVDREVFYVYRLEIE